MVPIFITGYEAIVYDPNGAAAFVDPRQPVGPDELYRDEPFFSGTIQNP